MQKYFHKKQAIGILLTLLLFTLFSCNKNKEETTTTPTFQEDTTLMETFTLINLDKKTHKLTLSSKKLTFYDVDQAVVVIHLFNQLDRQTRYMLKSLEKLQKKYHKDLFVASLLVGDTINTQTLKAFITKNTLTHFISNDIENKHFKEILYKSLSLSDASTLPLSVIYGDGEYIIDYEGTLPIEMITHDIKQAIKGK